MNQTQQPASRTAAQADPKQVTVRFASAEDAERFRSYLRAYEQVAVAEGPDGTEGARAQLADESA